MNASLPQIAAALEAHTSLQHIATLLHVATRLQEDMLLAQPRYADPRSLARFRSRVYSQNGEDGTLAEIFNRIGTEHRTFIEIGAGDGEENNTRFLLETGWAGTWCEAAAAKYGLRDLYRDELASRQLVLFEDLLTRENVAELLVWPQADKLDLLSIDIDMNTSHVWRALHHLRPRAAVIEYNPNIPPCVEWEVPYDAAAVWGGDNYYGASLKTLELIGKELGYALVGCEVTGTNAFFVREDLATEAQFQLGGAEFHHESVRVLPPMGHRRRKRERKALVEAA